MMSPGAVRPPASYSDATATMGKNYWVSSCLRGFLCPHRLLDAGDIQQSYICLKCTRIAEIFALEKKSGSRNTMVTSDLRAEVEIWLFRACAMHPAIIRPIGTVRFLWTWLWGRYHVSQNVFLVWRIRTYCNVLYFSIRVWLSELRNIQQVGYISHRSFISFQSSDELKERGQLKHGLQ